MFCVCICVCVCMRMLRRTFGDFRGCCWLLLLLLFDSPKTSFRVEQKYKNSGLRAAEIRLGGQRELHAPPLIKPSMQHCSRLEA